MKFFTGERVFYLFSLIHVTFFWSYVIIFLLGKSHSMEISHLLLKAQIVGLGLVIGLLTTSCSSHPSTTRFLVEQPDKTVGMEVTYRDGSPEYSHPAHVPSETLNQVLQHVEMQPSSLLDRMVGGSSTTQTAFSEEQRDFFSHHLSQALNRATPLETVTFYWATSRGNGIWELTSGGLYLQDHRLHLVLPNFRQTVTGQHPPQHIRENPLLPLGQPLHSLKAMKPAQQVTYSLATELWSPQTPHFVFPLHLFSSTHGTAPEPQARTSGSSQSPDRSTKARLQRLKELRQDDLLSEEEYQQKRQEILEKL